MLKKVIAFAGSYIVGDVITAGVYNMATQGKEPSKVDKLKYFTGALIVGSMVAEKAHDYIDDAFDKITDAIIEIDNKAKEMKGVK